jgi:hypothetical protein
MAESERDPNVSRRYRELGAEEPPRALDEAVLAASRRAAELHPAPLVPPTGRRRWYFPLAAAAVIVLSVALTWHMQHEERPDPDGVSLSEATQDRQAAPAAAAPAAKPAAEPRTMQRAMREEARTETPEKQLERIAELRQAGRHEEADRLLAEFRKRYPDYRISEEMLGKIERK